MSGESLLKGEEGENGEDESEELKSFYLESFVNWVHSPSWSTMLGVAISWLFVVGTTIVLFSLAYQEDLAAYKCEGPSAKLEVAICAMLVTVIIAMKMQTEERRLGAMRLVLKRHSGDSTPSIFSFALHEMFKGGEHTATACRLIFMTLFNQLRSFSAVTFIYVASVEQLMLFDTQLQYIINSVIVLVLAEVDELLHECFARTLLRSSPRIHRPPYQLTAAEQRLNEQCTNMWLLPLTCLSMLVPLMTGKLTGAHCSEQSRFRVSEISMLLLMSGRVIANVSLDIVASAAYSRGGFQATATPRLLLLSFAEHALPAFLYFLLLYFVLVRVLKPSEDDDLFSA